MLASLQEAVATIPANLADLSYSDPLGGIEVGELSDLDTVAEEQEVEASVFGNIQAHFVSSAAAMAYLIFILLYTPCAAAMGGHMFVSLVRSSQSSLLAGPCCSPIHLQPWCIRLRILQSTQLPACCGLACLPD